MELWIIEATGVKIIYVKWFLLHGLFAKWKAIIIQIEIYETNIRRHDVPKDVAINIIPDCGIVWYDEFKKVDIRLQCQSDILDMELKTSCNVCRTCKRKTVIT